jgi:hypothetical protein
MVAGGREILRPGVPGPRDGQVKRLRRNVLDEGEEIDEVGGFRRAKRREAEAAIGEHHRGTSMGRHRIAVRVPPDGCVEVGM